MSDDEITTQEIEAASAPKKRGRPAGSKNRFKSNVLEDDEAIPSFTLQDVADFALLRQRVWHDKTVLGLPDPLTDDPVLKEWRICNIFRELDAGTVFLQRTLHEHRDEDQKTRLLNAMIYRIVNRADAWTAYVGWIDGESPFAPQVESAFDRLVAASDDGVKVGTKTWRAMSLADTRAQALSLVDGLDELAAIASAATELKTFHAILSRAYGIGEFTAYQIALDVKSLYPNLSNDDWVYVGGKGARKGSHGGSMWALKRLASTPDQEAIDVARHLRDTQNEWLSSEFWALGPPVQTLRLEDVDNLACEFRKYWFKKHGVGALRRYGPEPATSSAGPRSRLSGGRGARRSESVNWETPPQLFKQLDDEFHFTLDAAASHENFKVPAYYTADDDALAKSWKDEVVYVFPPFNELRTWTEKAAYESQNNGATVVMLAPSFTETKWFHTWAVGTVHELRFVRGMVQFYESGEPRDTVFQSGVCVLVWMPRARVDDAPRVEWGYTYPDRPVVPRSGWTGNE